MIRLYLRTTTPHALALTRYGFLEPMSTTLSSSPPERSEVFPSLVEVSIKASLKPTDLGDGFCCVPRGALRESSLRIVEGESLKAMAFDEADVAMSRSGGSYEKLPCCLVLHPYLPRDDWLRLLGDYWSGFDNVSWFMPELQKLLGKKGPIAPMMSSQEQGLYQALPPTVAVYRGAGERNKHGMCWSLDREVAVRFLSLNRYHSPDPTLYTATVRKGQVLAVKADREEQEVITFGARIVNTERIR